MLVKSEHFVDERKPMDYAAGCECECECECAHVLLFSRRDDGQKLAECVSL